MDPGGASQRTGRSPETWRGHIIQQSKHRDRMQSAMFQDSIRFYTSSSEKTSSTKGISSSAGRPPPEGGSSRPSSEQQNSDSKKTTGESAYKVVESQQQIKIKECVSQKQQPRSQEERRRLAEASDAKRASKQQVQQFEEKNRTLKTEYDASSQRQREAESKLREEKEKEERVSEDMMHQKKQAAARMNHRNERRSRARQATVQKESQTAAGSKVIVDSTCSAPTSRSTSPKEDDEDKSTGRGPIRLFRSASATSPRPFLSSRFSFRGMFDRKRRGNSVHSREEDSPFPVRICLSARVPARPSQASEAHEQGINVARFSFGSDLSATGGTDRVVKSWDVRAGLSTHRATSDGSTEGITCVEFDATGLRILAASHDKSASSWRSDDSAPKVTSTGHSRKVTAARFTCVPHQVVTGSTDRTVRSWDSNRAACVQQREVASFCSDSVCSDSSIISGHFDCKIRVWDSRTVSCVQELPSQGRVTSLDSSSDRRQSLSCCRDDCLQSSDLRWSNERMCFRADGFKCGSDSTKAVISPDGCYSAAGSADGAVYIWNVSTGNSETRLPDQHSSSISAVTWSLSGEYFVSVDRSRRAVLWSDI